MFEGSGYPCSACLGSCINCSATHNVFLLDSLNIASKPELGISSTVTATNNVFVIDPGINSVGGQGQIAGTLTESYNLCLSITNCNNGTDIHGTPIFVGGSNPTSFTSYSQYALVPGSPGYHAASDGQSMGITG